jgi:hypothetical protein
MGMRRRERWPDWLRRMLGPTEPELGCEACFDQLDRYVELQAAGVDAAAEMPLLRAHLEGCGACRQEAEDLLELVRGDSA